MSRRDSRDSDSKRHRSRFDREPSPKRSRRDGKEEKDRAVDKSNREEVKKTDQEVQDQKRRRLQDALPLESPLASDAFGEMGVSRKESDTKLSGQLEPTKKSADVTEVSRSRSSIQHDDRGGARQAVRSSGHGSSEYGRRRNGDGNRSWRHDRYSEMVADPSAARKRPAFREKKVAHESENTDKTAVETAKASHPDHSVEGSRRKEDKGDNPHRYIRYEKQFGGDGGHYRGETQRDSFQSRERYTNGAGGRNLRGRDRFRERQGSRSSGGPVEKWKHDLYHEANRSPTPKNEEDQIAKVESLLAS